MGQVTVVIIGLSSLRLYLNRCDGVVAKLGLVESIVFLYPGIILVMLTECVVLGDSPVKGLSELCGLDTTSRRRVVN